MTQEQRRWPSHWSSKSRVAAGVLRHSPAWRAAPRVVAVGTGISPCPRTDPGVRLSRTGLLPEVGRDRASAEVAPQRGSAGRRRVQDACSGSAPGAIPPTEPPSLHALRRRSSRPCEEAAPSSVAGYEGPAPPEAQTTPVRFPDLPASALDPEHSRQRQIATAANALWTVFLKGKDLPVAIEGWTQAAPGVAGEPQLRLERTPPCLIAPARSGPGGRPADGPAANETAVRTRRSARR